MERYSDCQYSRGEEMRRPVMETRHNPALPLFHFLGNKLLIYSLVIALGGIAIVVPVSMVVALIGSGTSCGADGGAGWYCGLEVASSIRNVSAW